MRPPLKPTPEPRTPGEIDPARLYSLDELRRRLRWGVRSVVQAQRDGLRLISYGRQKFALGKDVLAFFESVAGEGLE